MGMQRLGHVTFECLERPGLVQRFGRQPGEKNERRHVGLLQGARRDPTTGRSAWLRLRKLKLGFDRQEAGGTARLPQHRCACSTDDAAC
jgi:hypothetical protein